MRRLLPLLLLFLAACAVDGPPGGDPTPTPGVDDDDDDDDGPTPTPTPWPESYDDAGTVELRRLNRLELDETFEHGLGSDLRPGLTMPADGAANGFDTLSASLTTSPLHAELYELAAHKFAASYPLPDLDTCGTPEVCAEFLLPLAETAWRRTVTTDELGLIVPMVGGLTAAINLEEALRAGVAAVLLSPEFVFRVELDDSPDDSTPHLLDPFELAVRLSYFLWSGPPDAELLAAAADGSLQEEAVLVAQAQRMLEHDRSVALIDSFGAQWMPLRLMDNAFPFSDIFASWLPELRAPLKAELRRHVESVILGDRSMLELVDYDETDLDPLVAAHYGLNWDDGAPVDGDPELRTFSLEAVGRRGVITNGAWLVALSQFGTVSPATRGVWILNQLLCEPPEPPPPEAGNFVAVSGDETDLSEQEQLLLHREDPACASCHDAIDPLGFALMGFDGAGASRDHDGIYRPFDPSGRLNGTGEAFDGPVELASVLAADARVPACIVEKTFTYAVGRSPGPLDVPHLAAIGDEFTASGHRFLPMVLSIVKSDPFRTRRAPEEVE